MSAQPVGPFRVLNQGAQGDDARDIIRRDASNEFVFAVVGHAGSGTSMIAGTLEVRLIEENLDGSSFQACLIKVRDAIQAWATKRQKPFPVTNGKRNLRDVRTFQDYGDEMRAEPRRTGKPDFSAVARGMVRLIQEKREELTPSRLQEDNAPVPDGKPRVYILRIGSVRIYNSSSWRFLMQRTAPIAAFLLAAGFLTAAADDPVKIDAGTVSGVASATPDVRVYKGIPFAAPPVGDLRWRAPQPVAHWDGVKKASEFSPTCTQGAGRGGNTGEDCLYLNVWTGAAKSGEKRPVMVWIYGGGYTSGSGSQAMYDGEALAKKGAVIVTFNYRLGALGFFSYPELTTESDRRGAGNFGVMDSIAALQWVQKNIAAFGGDPKNVTIFGESAGAGMVANLMAIPSTKGLFERAIGESSAWSTAQIGKLQTLAEAEAAGTAAAERMGAKSLAELRAKPAADILRGGGRGAAPIVDGFLIREDPGKVFSEGRVGMPVLVGSNRDESFGGNPRSAADFIEQVHKRYGDLADNFLKVYPASTDEQAKESAFYAGRDEMAFVMRNWAHLASKNGKAKSYVYFFTEQPPVVAGARGAFAPGPHGSATHVSEILYVFNHLDNSRPWTDQDKQVADNMSSYWVNFATKGDPNGKGLAKWTAWDEKTRMPMIFGNPPEGAQAPSDAAMAFFQSYFDKLNAK